MSASRSCELLRCDECGHWIAWNDFADKSARRVLMTPDAEGTREEWETLCRGCNALVYTDAGRAVLP